MRAPDRTRTRIPAWPRLAAAAGTGLALVLGACGGDGGTGPDGLRFGQIGEVTLRLEIPRGLGMGMLEQELVWSSDGPYRVEETISYDGVLGDRTVTREHRNPEILAGLYAGWIINVNELAGLRLFGDVDPSVDPECGVGALGATRIVLEITDEVRGESERWVRCTPAPSLGSLTTERAGPGHDAARVLQAAILLTNETVGSGFRSAYEGSVPFATLAKGEDSAAPLDRSSSIDGPAEWASFWARHTGGATAPPPVDFERDIVLVGAVGVRHEAGDSVEIRTVEPVGGETIAELYELVPGNFCSPVARRHVPFHIVRAPRVLINEPVVFSQPLLEPVPCGT